MNVKIVSDSPRMKRGIRKPQLSFNLTTRPWQIQPFMCHPVLPGETMKNLFLMGRTVSDPVVDKLTGWWIEYFVFYVKHRDLDIGNDLVAMHLDQSKDMSAFNSAAAPKFYHAGAGINYASKCLDAVKKWYFRDDEETEPAAIDGLPPAKINIDGWWQSMRLETATIDKQGDRLPGDVPVIPDGTPPGFETQFAQWEMMRAAGLTDASFEDYLRTFGVSVPDGVNEEEFRPELVRYVKEFTYPTNTVEPTTGVPSSAAVWSTSARADKDRLFKEPGFLFGVQVVRPKVYMGNVKGSIVPYMTKAFDWLPAVLQEKAYMSLKEFAATAGPAAQAYGTDYWVDLRDLLLHGEQFTNAAAGYAKASLPSVTGNVKYATAADASALFVDTVATGKQFIRTDGIVTLQVASSVYQDTSL